jgi:WD40 repeat protein/serine/threonine protein kinase
MVMRECPGPDTLALFLSAGLGERAEEAVCNHVEQCQACQTELARMTTVDVREGAAAPIHAGEPSDLGSIDTVIDRLRGLEPPSDWTVPVAGLARSKPDRPAFTGQELRPQIPGYELLGELGRGGMGIVYKARQVGLGRMTALKTMLPGGAASRGELVRFLAEAEAASGLQHANIVQVYEFGEAAGIPYYSMEFVAGGTLKQCQGGRPQPPETAARLVEALARAVHYAHQRGIAHRDLKPSNIMMTPADRIADPRIADAGEGRVDLGEMIPKIADFGLAKRIGDPQRTLTGHVAGTPSYLAPECAAGKGSAAGVTVDLYALGAILYELLTGLPPFSDTSWEATLARVIHDDPIPPRRLQPRCPRDLETICLKCLEKVPARRYASAGALADDLRRFGAGETVAARPPSEWERVVKFARRHKIAVAVGALVLGTLLTHSSICMSWAIAARANAARARRDERRARDAAHAEVVAKAQSQRNLYAAEMNLAGHAALSPRGMSRVNELVARWRPALGEADVRGWEWYYLFGLTQGASSTFRPHDHLVRSAALSPAGSQLATLSADGAIRIWDMEARRLVRTMRGQPTERGPVSWSPDGARLATAGSGSAVQIWEVATGRAVANLTRDQGPPTSLAWAPDSVMLAVSSADGTVQIWDAAAPSTARTLRDRGGLVLDARWSADGLSVASGSADGTITIWNARSGQKIRALRRRGGGVHALAWAPESRRLASAGDGHDVELWDVESGRVLRTVTSSARMVNSLAWSSDGRAIAAGGNNEMVEIWDVTTGEEPLGLRGHTCQIEALAWSGSGTRLASVGTDGTARIWNLDGLHDRSTLHGHLRNITALAWSPDGRRFASAAEDGEIRIWDTGTRAVVKIIRVPVRSSAAIAWEPGGAAVAAAGADGLVRVWDSGTWREIASLSGHRGAVHALAWGPDGRQLASAGEGDSVRIWDVAGRRQAAALHGGNDGFVGVDWNPRGRYVAGASPGQAVTIWDTQSGQVVTTLRGRDAMTCATWSPDGQRLACVCADQTITIHDTSDWHELLRIHGHADGIERVTWRPDGRRLSTASGDGTVELWDVETGDETLTLGSHTGAVTDVRWSPDGRALISGGRDGIIRIWDAMPGYLADRSRFLLPEIDRRLATISCPPEDHRLRAEILAGLGRWDEAAATWTTLVARAPAVAGKWFEAGWWVAGPVEENTSWIATRGIATSDGARGADRVSAGHSVRWRRTGSDIDFGADPGGRSRGAAFAALPVFTLESRSVDAEICGPTPVECWVNGTRAAESVPAASGEGPTVRFRLVAGWNSVVVRAVVAGMPPRLSVRLTESGLPAS